MKAAIILIPLALSLGSCRGNIVSYALEQGIKQGSLVLRAQPVEELIKDPSTDAKTIEYLKLSKEVLEYAKNDLGMNVGSSYQNFYDIGRPWVTKIVVAAHQDKLEPYLFSYPVVGDLPYKGFFDEQDALAFQKELDEKKLDTYVRNVPAFSSLGWWPDPILSTMFRPKVFFVELLLHELTHLNFYFDSEADFNEAFATWFSMKATEDFIDRYFPENEKQEAKENLKKDLDYELKLVEFIKKVQTKGNEVYASSLNLEEKRKSFFTWIETSLSQYPELQELKKVKWNNAYIVSLSTYYEMYQPIENYAQKHHLNYKEFLNKVIQSGEKIVPEIISLK